MYTAHGDPVSILISSALFFFCEIPVCLRLGLSLFFFYFSISNPYDLYSDTVNINGISIMGTWLCWYQWHTLSANLLISTAHLSMGVRIRWYQRNQRQIAEKINKDWSEVQKNKRLASNITKTKKGSLNPKACHLHSDSVDIKCVPDHGYAIPIISTAQSVDINVIGGKSQRKSIKIELKNKK